MQVALDAVSKYLSAGREGEFYKEAADEVHDALLKNDSRNGFRLIYQLTQCHHASQIISPK